MSRYHFLFTILVSHDCKRYLDTFRRSYAASSIEDAWNQVFRTCSNLMDCLNAVQLLGMEPTNVTEIKQG